MELLEHIHRVSDWLGWVAEPMFVSICTYDAPSVQIVVSCHCEIGRVWVVSQRLPGVAECKSLSSVYCLLSWHILARLSLDSDTDKVDERRVTSLIGRHAIKTYRPHSQGSHWVSGWGLLVHSGTTRGRCRNAKKKLLSFCFPVVFCLLYLNFCRHFLFGLNG